jgi:hypothetical protein
MEEMLPIPSDLREEAHLMELESMGYTIVHDAIPADLLRRLRLCHAQACQRIREAKPEADWSWESDNPGVVDYWRLYALDPVYEELLTLPSIYNICQRAIIEGRGGPGVQPHPVGPILVHEMGQHAPARTPGGQAWHQDGGPTDPSLRCTFTLNDLAPDGGGTIALAGTPTTKARAHYSLSLSLCVLSPLSRPAHRQQRSSSNRCGAEIRLAHGHHGRLRPGLELAGGI